MDNHQELGQHVEECEEHFLASISYIIGFSTCTSEAKLPHIPKRGPKRRIWNFLFPVRTHFRRFNSFCICYIIFQIIIKLVLSEKEERKRKRNHCHNEDHHKVFDIKHDLNDNVNERRDGIHKFHVVERLVEEQEYGEA